MLLSAGCFALIAWEVFTVGNLELDRGIAFWAQHLQSKLLTTIMLWVTFFGSSTFLLPVYLVLMCVCLFKSSRMNALLIALTGAGTDVVIAVLKLFFGRTRPVHSMIHPPITFSFPSGHSGSGMTLLLLLAFLITRKPMTRGMKFLVYGIMFLLGLAVGFTRIYLNVHYPTDVLSGFCVAFFWLATMYLLYSRLQGTHSFIKNESIPGQRNV
jgi:undecaprenyl-diphosphatase